MIPWNMRPLPHCRHRLIMIPPVGYPTLAWYHSILPGTGCTIPGHSACLGWDVFYVMAVSGNWRGQSVVLKKINHHRSPGMPSLIFIISDWRSLFDSFWVNDVHTNSDWRSFNLSGGRDRVMALVSTGSFEILTIVVGPRLYCNWYENPTSEALKLVLEYIAGIPLGYNRSRASHHSNILNFIILSPPWWNK